MSLTVRLDPSISARLDRVAHLRGQTRSEVVRDALEAWLGSADTGDAGSFLDAVAHVVGTVDTGGAALSERTGERLRALLEQRRARGSR